MNTSTANNRPQSVAPQSSGFTSPPTRRVSSVPDISKPVVTRRVSPTRNSTAKPLDTPGSTLKEVSENATPKAGTIMASSKTGTLHSVAQPVLVSSTTSTPRMSSGAPTINSMITATAKTPPLSSSQTAVSNPKPDLANKDISHSTAGPLTASAPFSTTKNVDLTATKAATSTAPVATRKSPDIAVKPAETVNPEQLNGRAGSLDEAEVESELSEPTSTVHSPSGAEFNEPEDEIVVSNRSDTPKSSPLRPTSEHEDRAMVDILDEPVHSHYPKRKRNSVFADLRESKIIPARNSGVDASPVANGSKNKSGRQSLGGVRGVLLGYWRDSSAPIDQRPAVIGFIDIRDRLRTRIQNVTLTGAPVQKEYLPPAGSGSSWTTFAGIVFFDYLVGFDQQQIKKFVKIRAKADTSEETEEQRANLDKVAIREVLNRTRDSPVSEPNNSPLPIAYGVESPEDLMQSTKPETKRRRTSGSLLSSNPASINGVSDQTQPEQPIPQQLSRPAADPLPGTRPTRILIGHWLKSEELNVKDRHAVYGILGQNDMFRVKLVRETRDGRFVDGNFPQGAGALWIAYEEVGFEPHLRTLARNEIKEYCRVRQWQIDHGETPEQRESNELKAVEEARARISGASSSIVNHANVPLAPAPAASQENRTTERTERTDRLGPGGQELRQSRRVEAARAAENNRPLRQPAPESESRPETRTEPRHSFGRKDGLGALERTTTLARREIARAEAAQGRADRHAANRERAAAAAAQAAQAAASAIPGVNTNGRALFHESEEMQRLNNVWARQESLRIRQSSDDAKIHAGIKYERKETGPFVGKLVSPGTIINIDGEDFVEYRILTKPSFF